MTTLLVPFEYQVQVETYLGIPVVDTITYLIETLVSPTAELNIVSVKDASGVALSRHSSEDILNAALQDETFVDDAMRAHGWVVTDDNRWVPV